MISFYKLFLFNYRAPGKTHNRQSKPTRPSPNEGRPDPTRFTLVFTTFIFSGFLLLLSNCWVQAQHRDRESVVLLQTRSPWGVCTVAGMFPCYVFTLENRERKVLLIFLLSNVVVCWFAECFCFQ